jgi:hypothetical protein
MCGVSGSFALKTEPFVSEVFIKKFRVEILQHVSHFRYFSLSKNTNKMQLCNRIYDFKVF